MPIKIPKGAKVTVNATFSTLLDVSRDFCAALYNKLSDSNINNDKPDE